MALHNTQCPHCFITYVISDEQLRVSQGMVRCGTCRERFQARLLKDDTETPRFDPREAFIEPLTEDSVEQKEAATKALADTKTQEFSFVDPHSDSEKSESLSDATVTGSINSDLSLDIDENAPVTPLDSKQLSAKKMLANIRAKQRRETEQRDAVTDHEVAKTQQRRFETSDTPKRDSASVNNESSDKSVTQAKLAEDKRQESIEQQTSNRNPSQQQKRSTRNSNKESLINEVDNLVNYELIKASTTATDKEKTTSNEPFKLDRKPKVKSRTWLLAPPLLLLVTLLSSTLIYQLWIKQLISVPDGSVTQKKIVELSIPLAKKLSDYDLVLPVRQNLNKLKLTSAVTEAHPTNASTTLLRISIINHAEFEQSLPWLEMTLTDADGRLVSRRNLSPNDYIYQNQTDDLIGARELKKITIELLSFPKQAVGYQIKVLNK